MPNEIRAIIARWESGEQSESVQMNKQSLQKLLNRVSQGDLDKWRIRQLAGLILRGEIVEVKDSSKERQTFLSEWLLKRIN